MHKQDHRRLLVVDVSWVSLESSGSGTAGKIRRGRTRRRPFVGPCRKASQLVNKQLKFKVKETSSFRAQQGKMCSICKH